MENLDDLDVDRKENLRLSQYKCRPHVEEQEIRRLKLLEEQKRRREENFNHARNIAEIFDNEETEDEDEKEEFIEFMEWTSEKPKVPRLKNMFMFSEWMVKLPVDFEKKWMFVLCPVGKRCLVRSSRGCTKVYSKHGHLLAKFQSSLPNGSIRDYNNHKYSNSEITLLDCIWSSLTKTYYILDLLCWKDQTYLDTDIAFRNFWVRSKVTEDMPYLLQQSSRNPYPFIPLQYYSCDSSTITSIMLKYPYFENDQPKIDGILFYHSDGHYTPGSTPLVLWLKPFMLPEIFCDNVVTSQEYLDDRPINYVNMTDYISKFEQRSAGILRKRKERRKKTVQHDEEMEEFGNSLMEENGVSSDIVYHLEAVNECSLSTTSPELCNEDG